jgi:hypothetical protein
VKAPPRRPTAVDHAVELTGELAAYARGEVGVIHPRLVLDLREHDEALRPDRRIVPTQSDDSSWIDTRHRGDDPLDVLRVVRQYLPGALRISEVTREQGVTVDGNLADLAFCQNLAPIADDSHFRPRQEDTARHHFHGRDPLAARRNRDSARPKRLAGQPLEPRRVDIRGLRHPRTPFPPSRSRSRETRP